MLPHFWPQLVQATDGLLYPSETDAPVEPVQLTPPFPWDDPALAVTEQPVHDFFAELTTSPDAAGFHALYGVLAASLMDLRVHRIGTIRVDVFVTGCPRAPSDDPPSPTDARAGPAARNIRYGIRTLSVET